MSFLKDFFQILVEGVPVWLRSVLVTICVIIAGMWVLGVNVDSVKATMYLNDVRKNSILLSTRAEKDKNLIVNESVENLYSKLCFNEVDIIGVSVVSFEPEIQPKILKVIAKDGNPDFERTIVVGTERYLDGGSLNLFLANREGISYMNNVSDNKMIMRIGVKSVMAMPIIYNGICLGSMIVFLGEETTMIDVNEYKDIVSITKVEVHQILDKLYYNY